MRWLVAKADLIELTDDDRAVILGLLVEAAATLCGEARERQLTLWRRRGKRAFDAGTVEQHTHAVLVPCRCTSA